MTALPVNLAFLSGAPGPGELIVIFLVILVLFGPRRLPEIARTIGKTLNDLRRASQDFKDQIMTIDDDPVPDPEPVETEPFSEEEDQASDDYEEEPEPVDDEAVEDDASSGEPGDEAEREQGFGG